MILVIVPDGNAVLSWVQLESQESLILSFLMKVSGNYHK